MVTLDKIREDMRARLEVDNALHNVDVHAETIDEALADAAVQLDAKAGDLEYEVVEKGSDGFLGFGKKPWKLRIYQNPSTIKVKKHGAASAAGEAGEEEEEVKNLDRDGLFYVHRFGDNIMLKVILPVGNGSPVEEKDVKQAVARADTLSVEDEAIKKYVKEGTDDDYQVVGQYKHDASGDASFAVDVIGDERATITANAPSEGGSDISADMIYKYLEVQGVLAGINDDKVFEFVDNPVYGIPYEVAAAVQPQDGHDAYISYNFETDTTKLKAKESDDGNINFKELNLIQNVVAGQALAKKIPAERGKAGKTISGRYLEAKNGKDIPIPIGQNTKLDADGATVVSEVNGQVLMVNGKITVQPVLQLDAVNIKSGNVNFLGTVIVKGNVDDGFDVTASGNVEIGGTVGKSKIVADGDVVIQSGVFGKDEGYIKAGKSLWAKFIQAANIDVEENIFVSDSIMNSNVTVMQNVVLTGKKAQITGGHFFAKEEICAKNIGSPGGTETILEVGFDPREKKRLDDFQAKQSDLMKELESLELDLSNLENQKKSMRSLPKEKQEQLDKLTNRKIEIKTETANLTEEIEKIQEYLRSLKDSGKVKASGTVYAGVKIYIRDVLDEVRADVSNVTFYYDNSFVKRGKYEPPKVERRGPDGYSAD